MPQMPQMPPGSLFLIPFRPCNPRLKKSPRPLLKITSVSSVSSVGTLILPLRYLCFSKIFSLPLSRNTIKTLRTSMATAYVSSTCSGGATFCRSITSFKGTGLAMCALCLTNTHTNQQTSCYTLSIAGKASAVRPFAAVAPGAAVSLHKSLTSYLFYPKGGARMSASCLAMPVSVLLAAAALWRLCSCCWGYRSMTNHL